VPDPFRLERFVEAQAPVYEQVRRELKAGQKERHWMWFIFPQIAGLGQSAMSIRFAIGSLNEAKAYLAHPVLGLRLRECARLALGVEGKTAGQIFGPVDAMRFRSSMTLFDKAAPEDDVFKIRNASGNTSVRRRILQRLKGCRSLARDFSL
jgi:uncharacterized protein (DUF1810 family)